MYINYNFAFKNSKLREWFKPAPSNYLLTNVSLKKKTIYLFNEFNKNANLFYPPTTIIILTFLLQLIDIYPTRMIKKVESDHNEYILIESKLDNLNSSKKGFKTKIKNIEEYFSEPTNSFLFAFYLQNVVPKGVQLNNYSFSDNGFDINASSYNIESLNELITLLIESPVVEKNSVIIEKLSRQKNLNSNIQKTPNFNLEIYGDVAKFDLLKREKLYKESGAVGLLKKFKRFNYLNKLLRN